MIDAETVATNRVHVKGFGTLSRRRRVWWIRYSYLGKRREESSSSDNQRKAEQLLRRRIQECGKGGRIDPTAEHRVRMEELFKALEKDYENNQRRSMLSYRLIPLREAFGHMKALDVSAARIAQYVNDRLAAKMARASVDRDLAALKRSISLAVEQERLSSVPKIKMLAEAAPRQGFVKPADFEAIVSHLPAHLQDFARFGYVTGTRKGEIGKLAWSDIDREGQKITFRREHAKNGQPRVIPFVVTLTEIIERRWAAREYKAPNGSGIAALVFHHQGKPIRSFRKRWAKACKAAKMPGLIFHDLRRSAVRSLGLGWS